MYLAPHGGRCCGIRHLYGMNHTASTLEEAFNRHLRGLSRGIAVEVVVTDNQLRSPRLREVLDRFGFQLTHSFRNANSGNVCNVFIRHSGLHLAKASKTNQSRLGIRARVTNKNSKYYGKEVFIQSVTPVYAVCTLPRNVSSETIAVKKSSLTLA